MCLTMRHTKNGGFMKKSGAKIWITIGVVLLVAVIAFVFIMDRFSVKDVTTSEFIGHAGFYYEEGKEELLFNPDKCEIDKVVVDGYNLTGYKKLENTVIDSLLLAKEKFPGQKNNLDALCKRFNVKE